ncbi:MAG: aldehyde ferredoxin oxidoreductase family protein [Anaerolineaceae bacterium]
MPFGYHGKILHVNLTSSSVSIEEPEESFYRKYLGGQAMGMYYLLKDFPRGADALSPENILAVTLSVVTGTAISGQSRVVVTAKSPLTGGIGTSEAGGFWPAEAKFAGFDAIIITGKAPKPVYLWLNNGDVEIRDAAHIWGKTTGETETLLKEELQDKGIQVLQIGPAGEKLVRFAAIMNTRARANGRTGMGAVMGSKNLKAIAVRGNKRPSLANPEEFKELASWGVQNFPTSDANYTAVYGTAGGVQSWQALGNLPTHNWDSGVFDGYMALSGETMSETILKERDTCFACALRCKRVVEIKEGPYQVDPQYGGPEYETIGEFGSLCCIDDLAAVSKASQLCNMYGMDAIQTGGTIAWLMDCYTRGLISSEQTDGLEMSFGSADAMLEMTEKIARREGVGNLLAEGIEKAADVFGEETRKLAVTVKGATLAAHMPQPKRSLALIYAANPYGADHMAHEHDPSYGGYPARMAELGLADPQPFRVLNTAKVRYTLVTQAYFNFLNSLGVCQFVWGPGWQLYGPVETMKFINTVTGWDFDVKEALTVGERSLNMLRAFNAREGITSKDDRLPEKLYKQLSGGATDGVRVDPEEMTTALAEYYQMAGWDTDGIPTDVRLEELGLDWVLK